MPMIMISPKRNLKGFDGTNKKTPISAFRGKKIYKKMSKYFIS
jgi:hypothetical protein